MVAQSSHEFWQSHSRNVTFLGKSEKADLAECGESFLVRRVRLETEGAYGPRWVLELEFEDGSVRLLSLAANSVRDGFMQDLQRTTDDRVPILARLDTVTTKNGIAYILTEPEQSPLPGLRPPAELEDIPF